MRDRPLLVLAATVALAVAAILLFRSPADDSAAGATTTTTLATTTLTTTLPTAPPSTLAPTSTTIAPTTSSTAPATTLPTTTSTSQPVAGPVITPGLQGAFATPSGNISCVMDEAWGVTCHVFEHEWTIAAPTDPDCGYDWGSNVSLGPDGFVFGCYSDLYWNPDAEALAYGTAMEVGDYRCESERTGLTCFNGEGDGFTVARATLDTFGKEA